MRCPEPIHEAVCQILRLGTLRARGAAGDGDAARCAVETDHIHNLPDLLREYSEEKLDSYWSVERPAFLSQVGAESARGFDQAWRTLAALVRQAERIFSDD